MKFGIETYFQRSTFGEFMVRISDSGFTFHSDELMFDLEGLYENVPFQNNLIDEWYKNPTDAELTKRTIETVQSHAHDAMDKISGMLLRRRLNPDKKESVYDRLGDPEVLKAWYEEVDSAIAYHFNSKREKAIA